MQRGEWPDPYEPSWPGPPWWWYVLVIGPSVLLVILAVIFWRHL